MSYLADELRSKIAEGDVLVVVGAGVSIGATQGNKLATWKGLVEDGIKRCSDVRGMPGRRADLLRAEVQSGHIKDLLSAAEKVSEELGFPSGAEYRSWLRETVGALKADNPPVLEALRDLNLPLATTHYDGLLEEVTGLRPVTWRDGDKAIRVIKHQDRGILHLHGFWDMPESVVLGIRSYEHLLQDDHAQTVLKSLRTLKTFLFVGCGEGLSDPNFDALFRWAREVFKDVGGRHYRLCQESDLEALRSLHKDDHIHPLSYGPDHSSLAPYIRALGSFSLEGGGKKRNTATTSSVPHALRLPGRPQCYGREDEVRDLVETLLQPSPPPIPILGGPGAGKTTIILEALYDRQVTARFGARRYFVRCDAASNREALVGAIARAIGLKPGPDVESSLFLELATNPAVVVLDNAETPWEGPDKAAVSDLLADLGCVTGLALVASIRGNERPWGPSWRESIQAGPLDLSAARQAFLKKSGRKFEDDPDLTLLLEEVERLALAVVLLGYNAQAVANLAELRRQWQEKRTAFLQRDGGQGPLENLEVSIELSISSSRMTPEARRLLSVLAHLPDGVALEALEALMPGEGGAAAVVLRRVGLALNLGTRVRVLAPVREYVRKQHPPDEQDLDRAIDHYLMLSNQGGRVGREGGAEASARVVQELGNADAMISKGLERANPEPAMQAAIDLGQFVRFTGWGSRSPVEHAMVIARESGRQRLQAACAERLGDIALYIHSDHDEARARYEEALPLYRSVGDLLGEANCIWRLGDIALRRSDHDAARARYEKALLLYRKISNIEGEATCFQRLGDIDLERFDHDSAYSRYEEALLIYRRARDVRGEARCIQGLGDILLLRCDHDAAYARYEEARSLYLRVGDVLGETNCIQSFGDIALEKANLDAARTHYGEALPVYRRLGGVLGEANCILGLGNIAFESSDYDSAHARFDEALPLFQKCGSVLGEAHCRKGFGDIELACRSCDAAHARYCEALALYRSVGSLLGEANCILALGDIALLHSDLAAASAKFAEALGHYQQIHRPQSIGEVHLRLARLLPKDSEMRQNELRAARWAWESIGQTELVEALWKEFGEIS